MLEADMKEDKRGNLTNTKARRRKKNLFSACRYGKRNDIKFFNILTQVEGNSISDPFTFTSNSNM
jgi:hypothetical protein